MGKIQSSKGGAQPCALEDLLPQGSGGFLLENASQMLLVPPKTVENITCVKITIVHYISSYTTKIMYDLPYHDFYGNTCC